MKRRVWLAWGATMVVAAGTIARHEHTLRQGERVLLALAPLDPRSLMQGDYMALRFEIAEPIARALDGAGLRAPMDGTALVALDEHRVARFVALGDEPAAGQRRLRFQRAREGAGTRNVRISTDAFFFQEGQAERYAAARYGEFALAGDGTALLVRLIGTRFEPL